MMPKMDVPQPVYNWLLLVKTDLRIKRARDVTWMEVFEELMRRELEREDNG